MAPIANPTPYGNRLLTIAIPTYNRARFLERLLKSIQPQLAEFQSLVEVLIVDNASQDDTKNVVLPFLESGLPFRYIGNESNIGMDANIRKCFMEATTEYVWIFGDDDVLLPSALQSLIPRISGKRYALIHVGGYSFRGEIRPTRKLFLNYGPSRETDSGDILYSISYLLTFITRNIVNKSVATESNPAAQFDNYLGSIINQLSFIFAALKSDYPCLILSDLLIAAQLENSGGYAPFQVFGKGMLNILECEFPGNTRIPKHFSNEILMGSFPYHILLLRQSPRYLKTDFVNDLKSTFSSNLRFWVFCYPLATLPISVASPLSVAVRAGLKAFRIAREVWWYLTLPRKLQGRSRFSKYLYGSKT